MQSQAPLRERGRRGLQSPPPPGALEEKHTRKPDGRPPGSERTISITPHQVVLRRISEIYWSVLPLNDFMRALTSSGRS